MRDCLEAWFSLFFILSFFSSIIGLFMGFSISTQEQGLYFFIPMLVMILINGLVWAITKKSILEIDWEQIQKDRLGK